MGDRGSLGQALTLGSLIVRDPINPAFALALNAGFPTRLSWALGASDTFSEAYRPSQTAHLVLFLAFARLAVKLRVGSVTWAPPQGLATLLRRLLPTLYTHNFTTTPGCSKALRGLFFPPGVSGLFARKPVSPGPSPGQRGPR